MQNPIQVKYLAESNENYLIGRPVRLKSASRHSEQ